MARKPNILLILCDDMGYSDVGCYGGFADTPNIDSLAQSGVKYTDFYSCPRCAPSRACLMTGLYSHQAGIGILTYNDGPLGYPGTLSTHCRTIAEILHTAGYHSYISGKWHLSSDTKNENANWPLHRGFEHHFGTLAGSGSYYNPHTLMRDNKNVEDEIVDKNFYYTDAISDNAVEFIRDHHKKNPNTPFFQYVAYTAPHWPLQAPEQVISKYKGRFDKGWDILRSEKLNRMAEMGLISKELADAPRDPNTPAWNELDDNEKAWYARCMEVYAAQIDVMDQGIGRILNCIEELGELNNTLIFFLSDNGGCNEEIKAHPIPGADIVPHAWTRKKQPIFVGNHIGRMPGSEDTFQTYTHWANLSNAPFRLYKSWVHEGGISSPLIVRYGRNSGDISRRPSHMIDIAATIYDVAGVDYPLQMGNDTLIPIEGVSLFSNYALNERMMFWEHQGNCAVRYGDWKAVCQYPGQWELYNLSDDRSESKNLATIEQDILCRLVLAYYAWAQRCCVLPRERILAIPGRKTIHNSYCGWMI